MSQRSWEFWIDRGGTFTDIVARRTDVGSARAIIVRKLLSQNHRHYSDAAVEGMRQILGVAPGDEFPREAVAAIKLGTTVATNALLERKGERTVLVTTEGFRDALRIGYQNRPDIFARKIVLPDQLYEAVIEAHERVTVDGAVLIPLNRERLASDLKRVRALGVRSCAIAFMHGYKHTKHEQEAVELAREAGFTQVSASHEVSPLIKLISRGETTVVDAYLSPILQRYIDEFTAKVAGAPVLFMQSNGGLVDGAHFTGRNSLLSGPAGGIVGAVKSCAEIGVDKLVSFDMGGTSTDVSHYAGEYERRYDNVVAGSCVCAPMMDIHTVAAGGGSIVQFRAGRLQVGPQSAGACPGPACYRNGGPLTITDCNLFLGRIQPDFFPKIFGETGDQPLHSYAVKVRLSELLEQMKSTVDVDALGWTEEQLAENAIAIAVDKMANAIKKVSIERGHDIDGYALCSFGGAGGQHACGIADSLGITNIVIHPLAGVLSALGIGLAEVRTLKQKSIEQTLARSLADLLNDSAAELSHQAASELLQQGVPENTIDFTRTVRLRYHGTDFAMAVPFADATEMEREFRQQHLRRYGFAAEDKPLTVESICIEAAEFGKSCLAGSKPTVCEAGSAQPAATTKVYCGGKWVAAKKIYQRTSLKAGHAIEGPVLIMDDTSTTVVEPGWTATCNEADYLLLTKVGKHQLIGRRTDAVEEKPCPAKLELFNNLFTAIAEEMGLQLQNTSHSVNIKERLDFSCAIFDAQGRLIANAPHIPVHLGSMGESIQSLMAAQGENLQPGDVFVLNNPFNGGTHLPDITVMTPIFDESGQDLLFFVASRGHHADIGGITPGSMPPNSTSLEEEGVVIDNFLLVRGGQLRETEMGELLRSGTYPARNVAQNIADLKAQVAASARGSEKLMQLVACHGRTTVRNYMRFIRENAALAVREVIDRLRDGEFSYEMDDGSLIAVTIKVDRAKESVQLDFSRCSGQVSTNLNAPRSICRAAVLYVFRTLIEQQIPLNDGCLEPIEIQLRKGSVIDPIFPAAVVAGNVETSQAVTDCLYGALGVMASAQSTMNNFTFGNETYQYYETICGGSGAGPDFDGTSAVHTHMTNSRLTDPEVLELRFPVLLESFGIRPESGGKGKHKGGDGAIRRLRFLEPMTASILSQRRKVPPFGLAGGSPGEVGRNYVIKSNGDRIDLAGTATVELSANDTFVIETPGGGGFGPSNNNAS